MGVDYSANYGIGVGLVHLDFDEVKDFDNMDDYIEELPEANDIIVQYFKVGNGYTSDPSEYYLCIADPLKDGAIELAKKIDIFKLYLEINNIEYTGEVDLVGGLRVY